MPGPIRVLHVDDEPDVAETAAAFLEREEERFTVETATGAAEAIDELADGEYDCVVSDYEMPGTDGIEFLDAVREDYPDLPFLLYTGRGSEEVASEAISAGVTDYLQKGRGTDQYALLANRIRNAVSRYRSARRADELERIRGIVREINQALVGATSRTEIEIRVCEIISEADPYRFAWIGAADPETGAVVPRAEAGVPVPIDRLTVAADDSSHGQGPVGRAFRSREIQVVQDTDALPLAEWRAFADEHEIGSLAVIPLVHDGTCHGILDVYADRPGAFDRTERDLLAELGDTIGHAIDAAEARERLSRQYEALFERAPVMYVITSAGDETVIEDCNRRFLDRLGYDREAVVGEPLASFYTEESARRLRSDGYQDALDDEFTPRERSLVASDGTVVETLLQASPRFDDGEVAGTLALFVDVTDRRRAARLEEFASVLAHDLRSPLNVAAGRVELAREAAGERSGATGHLDAVERSLDRMAELIDDVLALARAGEVTDAPEAIELGAVVERCWAAVETADATLVVEADRTIRADESRLRQLFENLIRNSVEHGGAEVTVTVGELPDGGGFYVADDGVGIPADDRERVFESGYSTTESGTGFGLAIVAKIADAHGWDLRVTASEAGGARFEFEVTGVDPAD